MSGTSLDGVDIAYCIIKKREGQWVYVIEAAQTIKYSKTWLKKLEAAKDCTGKELLMLDVEYGKYLGVLVQAFIMKNKIRSVDFVASHGHTIFHQPEKQFTFQVGNGQALHAASMLPVVYDFRSMDVSQGGQGAPLVPVGDKYLFQEYDACLNIGGIANVSMDVKGKRIAFDVCFANMGLNYLSEKVNQSFDKNGTMASDGHVHAGMLKELLKTYARFNKKKPSLSYEIFQSTIKPVLDREDVSVNDKLATFTESIAMEIAAVFQHAKSRATLLCTGGGVFNSFLMYRLVELCDDKVTVIVPQHEVVKFKEALVFAFLGVLRVRNEINCLKSVTGAKKDSCCGVTIGIK